MALDPLVLKPQDPPQATRVVLNRVDARKAAAEVLSEYLLGQTFCRFGDGGGDVAFQLNAVTEEWPEPDEALDYPSASISDATPTEMGGHALVPTPLEKTVDVFGTNTVLWKVAEMVKTFQVDFWANDAPTREAIAASLPGIFAPGEDGSRVILKGTPEHYNLSVRFTLLDYQRIDTSATTFSSERRLLARVQAEADIVELRRASIVGVTRQHSIGEDVEPKASSGE